MLAFSRQRFHAKKSGVFMLGFSRQGLKKRRHEIFYEMDPGLSLVMLSFVFPTNSGAIVS